MAAYYVRGRFLKTLSDNTEIRNVILCRQIPSGRIWLHIVNLFERIILLRIPAKEVLKERETQKGKCR